MSETRCIACGALFILETTSGHFSHRFCSEMCRLQRSRANAQKRTAAYRDKHKERLVEQRRQQKAARREPREVRCVICGTIFLYAGPHGSKERKTCSATCDMERRRQAASRRYRADPAHAKAIERAWRANHKEHLRAYRQTRREKDRVIRRRNALKKYGLSIEDWNRRFETQGHACVICGCHLTTKNAHVDHNHSTGVVRGILCQHHNVMIGMGQDNAATLIAGAVYLMRTEPAPKLLLLDEPFTGTEAQPCLLVRP